MTDSNLPKLDESASSPLSDESVLFESLSALMDGEASELELRRLLKLDNSEVEYRWQRYHLASAAMKGELKDHGGAEALVSLPASIRAAVDQEPILRSRTERKIVSRFWPNMARFSLAASVAGAVMVAVHFTSTETVPVVATGPLAQPVPSTTLLTPETTVRPVGQKSSAVPAGQKRPIILNETTQQRLDVMKAEANRLMLEHAQNASQHTQHGVLPYVRVPESE